MSETTNITAIEPKEYALRELKASDIFPMSQILSLIGIKEFKSCFAPEKLQSMMTSADNEEAAASVGVSVFFDIAGIVCSNLSRCEKEVYAFLSSLSGKDVKDIENLPMNTFVEMIMDVVQKEEFKDFMQVVSKLFK